ncbi:ADP-ribosylation factor protein 3, variant 2 [Entomophthora muscae]|nr:ADP-ribosylation factor protein 3, variant 2 [Entomophthora muscae]
MFTLLSGLYKHYNRQEEYSVVIIGLDNAGKTTLLEKIKSIYLGRGLSPDKIAPTVGLNIARIPIERKLRLNFWDLGGQQELHSIWEKYYEECHGIVFVIDSTDRERLEDCRSAFEKMISSELAEGVPVLMLANKQDVLGESMGLEEIKEIFNKIAVKLAARDSRVLPVSALNG